MRAALHILLHFAVPALVALGAWKDRWLKAFVVLIATMAVDLDHLFATPLYDPNRCSIGTHPLHTWPAIVVYVALALVPRLTVRLVGVGLLLHMALDTLDCWWMRS
jgi:hypothetical protein